MTTFVQERPRSSARGLRVFVLAVCLVILGLEGWRYWHDQGHEFERIRAETLNLAKSLTQHAQDTFELADALLVDVVDRVETGGILPNAIARLDVFLVERVQSLQRIKALTIYGEDGTLLSSSLPGHRGRVSIDALALFQHHRATTSSDWFVGPLIRDPLGGDWILTLSRRFNKPDGSFGGVVQASIPPRYFGNFFGRFDVGSQGTITLIHQNGTILSRYPYIERAIGSNVLNDPQFRNARGSGNYDYTSPVDGLMRIGGYQRNHIFPVGVIAAVGRDEALARWNEELVFRSSIIGLLILTIGSLGWILAGALRRREHAEAELAILATTDGLTGLANRRAFDRQLEVEWLRAARQKTSVSLLLIDVDQFKAYNDVYGHQAGDECLRIIAKTIAAAARRPGDLAARYGGEELAILLPEADEADAATIAENLRAKVEALRVRHDTNPPSCILTISIGSATRIPSLDRSRIGPDHLITLADAALYRAKQNGRNCVASEKAA
ncbi:sensor domain-containing diguanylate cyclase [Microvirga sp. CF3062]|uniref:sensor domain-containing diguanylate cyclase n=1 Tax=Microvirga sp. CF3062 TaxID=3110182 RepID=UPI002E78CF01|nr:sensor domain-containing diguanylate cyclase [Microvirga sp. CF3062]MEE1657272.1 sensor domain-containing diguanylate cyclase [Microvirga sp. CF3062]